jgi:hypothetical protein
MNLKSCPRCKPFCNGANFGGSIYTAYTGIIGGNNKIDQAKIEFDFESTNFRFNPIKSVFRF